MNTVGQGAGREASPIAIIGMGCLFPNAQHLTAFWRSIRRGEDGIRETPPTHWSTEDYVDPDPTAPDKICCGRGGFLSPVPFDPTEFGIPPTILEATDSTQLLGLVVAKAALEDAGYGEGRDFNRERVSVILGATGTQELVTPLSARLGYPLWRKALREAGIAQDVAEQVVARISDGYVSWQENSFPGLLGNVVAGRIANRLNLRGTNCVVDAACASSLSAAHMAMLELTSGRCDMVLTGGADTLNDTFMYMCFSKTMALSSTGDARPFSDEADGTVLGEGIGMLVLKRLADAQRDGDRIYAVIRGIGTSSDGRSQSIYAPHPAGQAGALRNAYRLAGFGPDTVGLIEAHGTGTKVGDVAEFEALQTVFREAQRDGTWCALGSVKSQIGHTKAAAGAAGLIKAALAIYHRSFPPTIKIKRPNPKMSIEESPFYLSTELRPWVTRDGRPRRAGVSSFGFGGSNFHAVLEEHQATLPAVAWDGCVQIIAMSADNPDGLIGQLDDWLAAVCEEQFDSAAFAYKAAGSRQAFSSADEHRLVFVVDADADINLLLQQAREKLAAVTGVSVDENKNLSPSLCGTGVPPVSPPPRRRCHKDPGVDSEDWRLPNVFYGRGRPAGKVAFFFSGQGSQYVGMGRELACTFPEVLDTLAEADAVADVGVGDEARWLSDVIYPSPAFSEESRERQAAALRRTDVAQPAIGAVSLGMHRVLERFGIKPDLVAGHSYGELTALCVAGRFDAETLHRLSRLRGRLMAEGEGDRGTMLAVSAPLEELTKLVEEERLDVVIANRNAPTQGILSGDRDVIGRAMQACQARGFATKLLPVSGAFHSRLMENAVGPFRQALEAVAFEAGAIPVFANTTGEAYPEEEAAARLLLGQQLIKPVDFISEVENLYHAGARTFVEVGPRAVLTGLVQSVLGGRPHQAIAFDMSAGQGSAMTDLARLLARLGALGHSVELRGWERPAIEPRKPKMVVPLVGANYRAPDKQQPTALEDQKQSDTGVALSPPPRPEVQPAQVHSEEVSDGTVATPPVDPTAVSPSSKPGETSPPTSPLLVEALRLTQESLQAMQTLQRQTAEAHQRFLEVQEQSHQAYVDLLAGQQHLLGQSAQQEPPTHRAGLSQAGLPTGGQPPQQEAPTLVGGYVQPPRTPSHEPAVPTPIADVTTNAMPAASQTIEPAREKETTSTAGIGDTPQPRPGVLEVSRLAGPGAIEPSESAPAVVSQNETQAAGPDIAPVVLEVVAEKTGYPREMLDLDMDIEADLGIDSIKRVEIVAAIEERAPELGGVGPEYMGNIRTLREIVALLSAGPPDPTQTPEETFLSEGSAAGVSEKDGAAFADTLLAVVSELTGYPAEMLDLDMDMEADLGIDSIKRVEILAAVEERLPDLPPVKPEYMGSLRTLRQIVDYRGGEEPEAGSAPVTKAPDTVPSKTYGAQASRPQPKCGTGVPTVTPPARRRCHRSLETAVERRALGAVELPEIQAGRLDVAPNHEVWVTDDGGDLSREIVARLKAAGYMAQFVEPGVMAEKDASSMAARASRAGPGPGTPIAGLIHVAPQAAVQGMTWDAASEERLKSAFALTKAAAADLRAAASKGDAILATVSRMDGAFGLRGGRFDPTQGGLAGMVKTAAREWPDVRCRAIDVAPTWRDAAAAAAAIVRELSADGPVEIGLDDGIRRGLDMVAAPVSAGQPALDEGDVVVITGGARGVTAACAVALAQRCKPTLVLLGRSEPPSEEPAWLAGLDGEAEIKQAILKQCRSGNVVLEGCAPRYEDRLETSRLGGPGALKKATPSPAELQAAAGRYMADREIRRNLDRIAAAGGRGVYRSVDVRNAAAVRTVLDDIRATLGPVCGLVHAAGTLADRLIMDKTPEQFAAVLDTKVSGLRNLLDAVPLDALKHIVLFSSVSGRLGNQGQVDYAMANEVLNKAAHRLSAELPSCRVVSMNWGPWDGGMVTPPLRREFMRRGVGLIPLDVGARCFVDEIACTDRSAVEVIIGSGFGENIETSKRQNIETASAVTGLFLPAFERTLDIERHPFLLSHVLDGHPVLPVAVMMEWLGQAAVHQNPGLLLHGFDDLRVLKGVVLRDGPPVLHFGTAKTRRTGSLYEVDVELRGDVATDDAKEETLHARTTVILAASLPAAPEISVPDCLAEKPYERGVTGAYSDVLFHGEHFRGILQVEGYSDRGMVARLRAAPAPTEWMADALRSDWLADPLVLDGAFQMGILWCHAELGAVSLPTYLGRYRQFRRAFPKEGVRAILEIRERTPHKMSGNFTFFDGAGVVVALIVGYECTADASLLSAFRRGTVAGAPS